MKEFNQENLFPIPKTGESFETIRDRIIERYGKQIEKFSLQLGERTPDTTEKLVKFIDGILDLAKVSRDNPSRAFAAGFLQEIYSPKSTKYRKRT